MYRGNSGNAKLLSFRLVDKVNAREENCLILTGIFLKCMKPDSDFWSLRFVGV
jgi:hypothetical protein